MFCFRADDIEARMRILDLAEASYAAGDTPAAAILAAAERYLRDRAEYQAENLPARSPAGGGR
jgi:hypothetical protein